MPSVTRLAAGAALGRSAETAPGAGSTLPWPKPWDEWGIDISREPPGALTDEAVETADVVVGMGCGDACPVLPGKRYLEWHLDVPVAA